MTSTVLLAFLLTVKHLFIANILDFGYSRSRDTRNRYWWVGFVGWTTAELLVTEALLPPNRHFFVKDFIFFEFLVFSTATYYERNALLGQELRTHFFWEGMILLLYACCALLIVT